MLLSFFFSTSLLSEITVAYSRCRKEFLNQELTDRVPFLSPNKQCQSTEDVKRFYSVVFQS